MIYKSFILNLNSIDLGDPRMRPSLGAGPGRERRVRGEDVERQTVSGYRQSDHRMPEVKPVSSGEWGQLSCLGPCIVLISTAAVSYQKYLQGESRWGGGVGRGGVDRKERACVWGK